MARNENSLQASSKQRRDIGAPPGPGSSRSRFSQGGGPSRADACSWAIEITSSFAHRALGQSVRESSIDQRHR